MRVTTIVLVALLIATLQHTLSADTVKLKNGQTVEGVVIKFGSEYRVKQADGTTRIVKEADVAAVLKGGATATGGAPDAAAPAGATGNFAATKARADTVDVPLVAVTLWEKFIESKPSTADTAAAKAELEKWQKLADDRAERINGKWIGGEQRRKLLHDVEQLCAQARGQLESQTLQAIDNYEKALKLYPNCFEAHYALGYFYLSKGAPTGPNARGNLSELDRAIRSLEAAVKLRPDSAGALSNLAVGYSLRQRFEESVLTAYKAARIEDNKPIVENLVNCIVVAPPGLQTNNRRVQPIIEQAAVLARKYGISPAGTGKFRYLIPEAPARDDQAITEAGAPGVVGNGSGFLVSADGYIITNKHVVEDKSRIYRVRFDDGTEKAAEVVAVDPSMDVAMIKIKPDKPLAYLKLAAGERPNPGALCMVLGYPIASLLDYQMQVTSGEVTSVSEIDDYQVTLTANTTHGNSGGPIVDRDGNVIGILSAGQSIFNATYLKAISAAQIRSFVNTIKDKLATPIETGAATPGGTFDGEKLAAEARKATVMIIILRGDREGAE
jgi:S1-C subfamily serine protease